MTARYNRDYLEPRLAGQYPLNHHPYGGDTAWRMGDYARFQRPYLTRGGSFTYRGGRDVGWEHPDPYEAGPYARGPRRYEDDYPW